MSEEQGFKKQFYLEQNDYLKQLDYQNWHRYFFIIKEVINLIPNNILEIGTGSGIVRNCLQPLVKSYTVLDVNPKLKPDFAGDIRTYQEGLENKFDCVIIADVLEHVPYCDLEKSIKNIYLYLANGGKALITIPHRRSHFLFMTPVQEKPHVFTVPTGFLSPGAFYRRFIKRKIWIDPHHCWEIGDGKIKKVDVELTFKRIGFIVDQFKKLLYVDFWALIKRSDH
jgi:SAM-dependent methyltransferase